MSSNYETNIKLKSAEREEIERKTAEFLASGGVIERQEIEKGRPEIRTDQAAKTRHGGEFREKANKKGELCG